MSKKRKGKLITHRYDAYYTQVYFQLVNEFDTEIKFLHFSDGGEPEDSTLARDWSDIYGFPTFVQEAFKHFEELSVKTIYHETEEAFIEATMYYK